MSKELTTSQSDTEKLELVANCDRFGSSKSDKSEVKPMIKSILELI